MPAFENPKTTHFEFMGVPGSYLMIFGLPVTVYALFFLCNGNGCDVTNPNTLPSLQELSAKVFSLEVSAVYVAWFFFQAILHIVLPGEVKEGLPLRDGTKLKYTCNGQFAFWVSILSVAALHFAGVFSLSYVYDNFLPFITASVIFSYLMAIFVYVRGKREGAMLAEGGNSGWAVYDFFIGHELNPRIGDFDLKFFCELRPGLIGWVVINLGMMAKQYENLGTVTNSMVLVNAFQFYYVLDAFISETCIMSTMDITTDGFGLMLAFGDLAWVPMLYTIQARYLVDFPQDLSHVMVAVILAVQLTGYWIFRGSNGQKDAFRSNPNDPKLSHLKYIPTATGSRLLISGWWGMARHINYFGDLLMALAWSLPCGFGNIIPYFYPIYFAVLLIHRERRDDHKCHSKYKADWEKYRKLVPYRIIPYVY